MFYRWIAAIIMLSLALPLIAQDESPSPPSVAFVSGESLYLWVGGEVQTIADADALLPLAVRGTRIVYLNTDGNLMLHDGDSDSLLIPHTTHRVMQVAWLDESTLVFNTRAESDFGITPQDDLYTLDIQSGDITQVFAAGEGGVFSLSPDAATVAITSPGVYGEADGMIRLYDVVSGDSVDAVRFSAVSSGSHVAFYPRVQWLDAQSLRVAIPDADLLYGELSPTPPPTRLIGMTAAGELTELGALSASFFGLPIWALDGESLLYQQRIASEILALMITDSDDETVQIDTGAAGDIGGLHATDAGFIAVIGGELTLIQPDGTAEVLHEGSVPGWSLTVRGSHIIFVTLESDGTSSLWHIDLETMQTTLIGSAYTIVPAVAAATD